ncbi:MAG: F0F1 ATP synthase subunit gamma, partial [Chloroflexota bacterium]
LSEYVKDVPDVSANINEYEFEPNPTAVLDQVVPRFTELQLYQAALESMASEHAARMVAMKNASDNAIELVGDLTLVYNKARQSAITSEILDIVGGAEALQGEIDKAAKSIEKSMAQKSTPVEPDTIPAAVSAPVVSEPDDLTKVEGIGPKMSGALNDAGIDTYQKLAEASEDDIRKAIEDAGMRLAPGLDTWPEQAEYLAKNDEEGLKAFQDTLSAGRRTE